MFAATFALSGIIATTGVTSVALGAGAGGPEALCPGIEEDRPAAGILDCLGPSTVYVENEGGASGSGLVLEDGYVVTNAHVVDPWRTVDLTIGEEEHLDVPVVGVDLFADIAVVGPIETKAPFVELADPSNLVDGDRLFLVGYPGEVTKDDLKPTIADGILSRTRHSKEFDLSYLQTDASIGGGQSGGALVDLEGRVVGISSLRFAENFALALSAVDTTTAVAEILAGRGSPYESWPGGQTVTEAVLPLEGDYIPQYIAFPDVGAAGQTVDITVPADLPVLVVSGSYESDEEMQFGANLRAIAAEELDLPYSALAGATHEELTQFMDEGVELAEEISPGTFRFRMPEGEHPMFAILTNRPAGFDLPLSSSVPMVALTTAAPADLVVGSKIDGFVGSLVPYDTFHLVLNEGQSVEIYAGSPSGDVAVYVQGPDQSAADAEEFDDSEIGLYGLDVEETYTATVGGVHVIEVGQLDPAATGYHLEIREP